uniref:Uncharacterized protein n=1 Tax=Rhizophagus irregularis (strain DAOM 181602 / DAOM 197198 / MUCL 43194) TaxID=747089 RepID=U9SQS3_RHIID
MTLFSYYTNYMIVFLKNIRTIKKVFNIKPSNGSLNIRIYFTEVNNSDSHSKRDFCNEKIANFSLTKDILSKVRHKDKLSLKARVFPLSLKLSLLKVDILHILNNDKAYIFFHMIVNKIMAVNSFNPTERVGLLIVKLESFRGITIGCYKLKSLKKDSGNRFKLLVLVAH